MFMYRFLSYAKAYESKYAAFNENSEEIYRKIAQGIKYEYEIESK